MIIKQNSIKIDKIYAYQADEMKAIWLQYHEPDLEEIQISARDVK